MPPFVVRSDWRLYRLGRFVVISIAAALVAVPTGYVAFVLYADRCTRQSDPEAAKIEKNVRSTVRKQGYVTISDISERQPKFFCILGHKSILSDVRRFAASIQYRMPTIEYCGAFSFYGRMLLFFDDGVLDVRIPASLVPNLEETSDFCSADVHARFQ